MQSGDESPGAALPPASRAGVRTRLYRSGILDGEDFALADIPRLVQDPSTVVWADLCQCDHSVLEGLARDLHLHRVAVEDAESPHQRPKLDRYGRHALLDLYLLSPAADTAHLQVHEISVFLLPQVIVTVRSADHFDIDELIKRWDANPDLLEQGIGALVHGLVDLVVDHQYEAVAALDEEIERLEDLLFSKHRRPLELQRQTFELRRTLVLLRRTVLPMREVLTSLMRPNVGVVAPELLPYFQDVYNHVLRTSEWTESLRDLLNSVLEANLTIESNSLNIITKKVTSWAAIIAVPTLVTGFYGMNVPYPGSQTRAGLYSALAVLIAGSLGLFVLFRRKDWL